jgi:hypothetical protein
MREQEDCDDEEKKLTPRVDFEKKGMNAAKLKDNAIEQRQKKPLE